MTIPDPAAEKGAATQAGSATRADAARQAGSAAADTATQATSAARANTATPVSSAQADGATPTGSAADTATQAISAAQAETARQARSAAQAHAASRPSAASRTEAATAVAPAVPGAGPAIRPVGTRLGIGIGWRAELDLSIARMPGVDWVEVVAENLHAPHLPESLLALRDKGMPVLPHAVSLSLGGAEPLDTARVEHLAELGRALDAPLVSDHVCFVRAGGLDSGHLMPLPRTREALDVLVANVRLAQSIVDVPFALENIAALLEWPENELTEEQFLTELTERTGCLLIIDVANLYANARNVGTDPAAFLDGIPWERLAYVHMAGGIERDGVYHDTHAHPVLPQVLDLLAELRRRTDPPGVLLERDDDYPTDTELAAELAALRATVER